VGVVELEKMVEMNSEFANPLTALVLSSELLYESNLNETQIRLVQIILRSADRLTALGGKAINSPREAGGGDIT